MATKIISVSYGHGTPDGKGGFSASRKLYDYETEKNYRTGDVVVVPVTHKSKNGKRGKTYNTLGVVRITTSVDTKSGHNKLDHLTDPKNNISPKNISLRLMVAQKNGVNVTDDRSVNITTLPGYDSRLSNKKWSAGNDTKNDNNDRTTKRGA